MAEPTNKIKNSQVNLSESLNGVEPSPSNGGVYTIVLSTPFECVITGFLIKFGTNSTGSLTVVLKHGSNTVATYSSVNDTDLNTGAALTNTQVAAGSTLTITTTGTVGDAADMVFQINFDRVEFT